MSNILTREQYLAIVNENIDNWPIPTRVYFTAENGLIDSTNYLQSADDWGLPLPFGWIVTPDHFTGDESENYSTDNIIEVRYD